MLPGIGGLNPKKMQAVMKQMGISQSEIPAKEVIIKKTNGEKIIIENPSVIRINMQGQESFQITGQVREESQSFNEEDIKTIVEKTGKTESEVKKALEETNDIAEAIIKLSK